jgi:asparagine synthase (glutamine-hydrolysing)
MCGIVGIVASAESGRNCLTTSIAAMADSVAHRGPDDHGYWIDQSQGVALGHRRLAILDLSPAGRQPLVNETGTIRVVFNGEIYNFQSLKDDLERRGHRFRSHTDGEVIVHAYEEYGERCVEHLDGMFAFALWDQDRQRLMLARDRAGKKPLYYQSAPSLVLFGSEIKALLAHPHVSREVDPAAVPLYLAYGYVPAPRTFYRQIVQVPAASYVVIDQGRVREPVVYWALSFPPAGEERRISERDACVGVRQRLSDAVHRRLLSDVPLGAFLSGGVDSSIVVGLMSQMSSRPVRTFSIGFTGGGEFDETPHARIVASHFRTNHTEFIVEPKAFDLMNQLLWHHDQPYGDSSAIPTFLLAQLAKSHVTVALNGDGGDEVFAGYGRFLQAQWTEQVPRAATRLARAALNLLPARTRSSAFARLSQYVAAAEMPLSARYRRWCSFFPDDMLRQLLIEPLPPDIGDSFDQCLRRTAGQPTLHRLLDLNFRTYLPDDLLVKMDRMSMAHGLETRSPFLDTALIEYVASLPAGLKVRHGRLKSLLKRAFRDVLPPPILRRRKQGFAVPLDSWFRADLRGLVGELLLADRPRYRRFLSVDAVRQLCREHQSGSHNRGSELWALLNLEAWLQQQGANA